MANKWLELKTRARQLGINTYKMDRAAIMRAIEGIPEPTVSPLAPVAPVAASPTVAVMETDEQKRARLLAELAALAPEKQNGKASTYGPNYWAMSYSRLKAMLIERAIINRVGTVESMVSDLQADDSKRGVTPHPQAKFHVHPPNIPMTTLKVKPNNHNSAIIEDVHGNKIATIYRIANTSRDGILDMHGYADMMVEASKGLST
jgi:hypothetical protein